MNILLTGPNGFIGRNIREKLLDMDYFKRWTWKIETRTPLYNLFAPNLDIRDFEAVNQYINENKIETVIHTAVSHDLGDNIRMFFNLIRSKVNKIINLGSGAEYDKRHPIIKVKEDDIALPLTDYGLYKHIVSSYKDDRVLTLRLFGVYGKYEPYGQTFISNAICRTLTGLRIKVFQDCKFDYLYIDDFVKILHWFITHEHKYSVYNVTPTTSTTLLGITELIKKKPILLEKKGMANEYTGDNTRLLSEMGKFEFTPISKGVEHLLNYYHSQYNYLSRKTICQTI